MTKRYVINDETKWSCRICKNPVSGKGYESYVRHMGKYHLPVIKVDPSFCKKEFRVRGR